MNIEVNIKDLSEMRYNSLGDYYEEGDNLIFDIVKRSKPIYTKLVLLHEIIEQMVTEYKCIKECDILSFDLAHPDSDDAGFLPDAPYRNEHTLSDAVERIVCAYLGIDFNEYYNSQI